MKRTILFLLLAVSLLLSGCSFFEGSYVHVTPHLEQKDDTQTEVVSAANYRQLLSVVEAMVGQGVETGVINVSDFDQDLVEKHMRAVAFHIRETYPVGAYAVEDINFEIGTSSGRPAIAVTITYRHSRIEIQRIRTVRTMESAALMVGNALESLDAVVVLEVEEYVETDFSQIVEDYAELHPDTVMETPHVAAAIYGTGTSRVIELTFIYQTSRDALRSMQSQVRTVFDSAALYVSGEGAESQKFSQLYGFLMERFDYTQETSITPAYSLLRHGVGDSRAFAEVYAAMCRQAGLNCRIVTGTKDGEPWVWNMIQENGSYFHVDLLRSSQAGGFRAMLDGDMGGYVWDYSAYPECIEPFVPTAEDEKVPLEETTQSPTEETAPPAEETLPPEESTPEETMPEETVPQETVPEQTEAEATVPEESTENFE